MKGYSKSPPASAHRTASLSHGVIAILLILTSMLTAAETNPTEAYTIWSHETTPVEKVTSFTEAPPSSVEGRMSTLGNEHSTEPLEPHEGTRSRQDRPLTEGYLRESPGENPRESLRENPRESTGENPRERGIPQEGGRPREDTARTRNTAPTGTTGSTNSRGSTQEQYPQAGWEERIHNGRDSLPYDPQANGRITDNPTQVATAMDLSHSSVGDTSTNSGTQETNYTFPISLPVQTRTPPPPSILGRAYFNWAEVEKRRTVDLSPGEPIPIYYLKDAQGACPNQKSPTHPPRFLSLTAEVNTQWITCPAGGNNKDTREATVHVVSQKRQNQTIFPARNSPVRNSPVDAHSQRRLSSRRAAYLIQLEAAVKRCYSNSSCAHVPWDASHLQYAGCVRWDGKSVTESVQARRLIVTWSCDTVPRTSISRRDVGFIALAATLISLIFLCCMVKVVHACKHCRTRVKKGTAAHGTQH